MEKNTTFNEKEQTPNKIKSIMSDGGIFSYFFKRFSFAVIGLVALVSGSLSYYITKSAVGSIPPITIELAGCVDKSLSEIIAGLSYDINTRFPENFTPIRRLQYVNYRAQITAGIAVRTRSCYSQAIDNGYGFDANGLIGSDLDELEDSIDLFYAGIVSSVVPNVVDVSKAYILKVNSEYRRAQLTAERISIRLGKIVSNWYL